MRAKCRHFVYQFVADIYADIVPKVVILLKLHSIQTTAAYKVAYPYCVRIWTFLQKGIATPNHRLPDKTLNFDNFVNPKTDKTVDFSDFVGLKADRNAYFGNFVDQSTKYTHTKRTALMRRRPFVLCYDFFRGMRVPTLQAPLCLLLRTTCALHIAGFVSDFLQQFSN